MAKVKDSISVPYLDEDGISNQLHLIFDCDDDIGYGVEFLSDEEGIASWSFGDNSIESYILAEGWYEFTSSILTETSNLPDHIIDDYCIWIEDESPTEEDEEKVLKMIELMTDFFGYHPLEEKRVNELRDSFGWPEEEGIWTKFIQ
jgi:hypothetical protein